VQNAESLDGLTNVQNAVLQVHRIEKKEDEKYMGSVVITYKVFPTGVEVNFDDLKKKIEASIPEFASIDGYGEEPIAFGLKALLMQVRFPEDKTGMLEEFEKKLEGISEVSQLQTIMVRRTSR
jgi:elongation factor 1-beta